MPTNNTDNGPVYVALNASHSLDAETMGNGGWSAKDGDDESNTSSSTSTSSSDGSAGASSGSTTETRPVQRQQNLEEQLINNSSDDSGSNDQFNSKLRSKTLPDIYTRQNNEQPDQSDPFMMAPFPVSARSATSNAAQQQSDQQQHNEPSMSNRTIADTNPFKTGSSFDNKNRDPFEHAPFHA